MDFIDSYEWCMYTASNASIEEVGRQVLGDGDGLWVFALSIFFCVLNFNGEFRLKAEGAPKS